jgi:hypothetical protein
MLSAVGRRSVSTAVAAKCLVPQEAAGPGGGGGAKQLVLNNACSIHIISPKLGGVTRH